MSPRTLKVEYTDFSKKGRGKKRKRRGMEGRRGMEEWIEGEREKKEGREGGRTPWSLFFKDTNPMVVGPPP